MQTHIFFKISDEESKVITVKTFRRIFLLFSVSIFVLSAASFVSAVRTSLTPLSAKAATAAAEPNYYIVKEYMGSIGIYPDGSESPSRIVHITVDELPDEDRYLLECGILVRSYSELRELIEDYTG